MKVLGQMKAAGDYWLYFYLGAIPVIASATWIHPIARDCLLALNAGLVAVKGKRSGNGKKTDDV